MLLTCRDDVGRMLIGYDFFQASQVVSWQNVGRMLSGQYVERMLIQLEKAHKPTVQQVLSGQNVGNMLSGHNVERMLM